MARTERDQRVIKIAIAGVGNCASSLLQGIEHYGRPEARDGVGLMHLSMGGYAPGAVEVVAAFDVDCRKVGRPLHEAAFALPNCTTAITSRIAASDVIVQMGPVHDGVAPHMADYPDAQSFRVADEPPVDVAKVLAESGAEILVSYLPVGSQKAVSAYAEACLATGVSLVNCVPVFIVSDPAWGERFRAAGIPCAGDDIKSQLGATILHRTLARLFVDRGVRIDRTYQLNTGGNTDFLNMLSRERLASKKVSKTEAVTSQLPYDVGAGNVHIGPSDYVAWLDDRKWAYVRLEGRAFGDVPLNLEYKLEVWDSPNSAGVIIDAVRCAKIALDRGVGGPVLSASSYFMKSPPEQYRDDTARQAVEDFIAGR